MFDQMGKVLISLGLLLVLVGGLMMLSSKIGIGRLPGDITFQKGNFTFYFPLVSCVVISVLLTALLWLLRAR